MSTRKSHGRRRRARTENDPEKLTAEAGSLLSRGRFRDAVGLFKKLVEQDRRPEWVDGLSRACEGYARELAGKGMVEEALEVWRNRSRFCGKPLWEGPYLEWVLRRGKGAFREILGILSDPGLSGEVRTEIEKRFAVALFCLPPSDLAGLPSGDPFSADLHSARESLAHYRQGKFGEMDERLGSIPFRSPFSFWKILLKSLVALEAGSKDAAGLIGRIPPGTSFDSLAKAVRVAVLPEEDRFSSLSALDPDGRRLVLDLWGCPENLVPFAAALAEPGGGAPDRLLSLLLDHRKALPSGLAETFLPKLLPHVPRKFSSISDLLNGFPAWKIGQVKALARDQEGDWDSAIPFWEDAARKLSEAEGDRAGKEIALIWRRLGFGGRRKFDPERDRLEERELDWLRKSLDYDPYDRDTLLVLSRACRASGDAKSSGVYLSRAMDAFPEDPEVLSLALDQAFRSKSYKKAITLGRRLLLLDSIDPVVRTTVGRAHLFEARKMVREGFFPGARKELKAADEALRDERDRKRLRLLEALASAKEGKPFVPSLPELLREFGPPLAGLYLLAVEADRMNLSREELVKEGGLSPVKDPAPRDLLALARLLGEEVPEERSVRAGLSFLRPFLKKVPAKGLSSEETASVCEALLVHGEPELSGDFARAGLRLHRKDPRLTLLSVRAKVASGGEDSLSEKDGEALDEASETARQRGDLRTAAAIEDILEKMFTPVDFDPEGAMDPDMDAAGSLEVFLSALRLAVEMDAAEEVLDIAEEILAEKELRAMKRRHAGNRQALLREILRRVEEIFDAIRYGPDFRTDPKERRKR